jgi:hypothetical protein
MAAPLQEIDMIVSEFKAVDFSDFNLNMLHSLASRLNWQIHVPLGKVRFVVCKAPSPSEVWGGGIVSDTGDDKIEWFRTVVYQWKTFHYETVQDYGFQEKTYNDYYETVKEHMVSILKEPEFSTVKWVPIGWRIKWKIENLISSLRGELPHLFLHYSKREGWRLKNGVVYLYQGDLEPEYDEVGLLFTSLGTNEPIPDLEF